MNDAALAALPDDELVRIARFPDSRAVLELLRRVSPFILYKSRQFGSDEQDRQDFYQEGVVGFLSAVHSFKVNGGAKFTTYACTCALNRMKNLLRQRSRGSDFQTVSLSEGDEVEDFSASPEDYIQAQDEAQNIADVISTRLSGFEQRVISLYLSGDCYAEIAAKTDTNTKSVDNAMQRIRRKLS